MKMSDFLMISLAMVTLAPFLGQADNNKLSLSEVLRTAENQHPDIAINKAKVSQAVANQQSAPSLPPPLLAFGAAGSSGALNSNGRMENSVGISQTIPFPTKLTSESKAKKYEVLAAEKRLQGEILKIHSAARAAFFALLGTRNKIILLQNKQKVLEEHFNRVRSATLSDRIAQAHRIWVQTQISLVKNALISAREEEQIYCGKLNFIMGNDQLTALPMLEEPPLSELPLKTDDQIKSTNPQLSTLEAEQKSAQAMLSQSKSLWLPDLTIGYRNARRFDGVMPNYSEVTVGVTLPFLLFWEPNGQVAEASARAQEAEAKYEKANQELKLELLVVRTRTESLREQILNYEQNILPQAEKRAHIAHGLVPSDMESLNEHRDAMVSIVDLKMEALNLRIDYEYSVAKLESLLAGSVTGKEEL